MSLFCLLIVASTSIGLPPMVGVASQVAWVLLCTLRRPQSATTVSRSVVGMIESIQLRASEFSLLGHQVSVATYSPGLHLLTPP